MEKNRFDFSENWNGKLFTKHFTTLRLNEIYEVGKTYEVWLQVKKEWLCLGTVKVLNKKPLLLNQINDSIGFLDTGYDGKVTQSILMRMYVSKKIDWNTKPIYWYLLEFTERVNYPPLPEIKNKKEIGKVILPPQYQNPNLD